MSVVLKNSISRRKAIGGMAAATAATVALPGIARAMGGSGDLRVFRGKYVFHGDRMVDGYIVSPLGIGQLDTVILLHGANGLDAAALAAARLHASSGKMVVLPDLTKGKVLASREARIADLTRNAGAYGKHGRGSGRVEVIAA